jgi:hypothetical protein
MSLKRRAEARIAADAAVLGYQKTEIASGGGLANAGGLGRLVGNILGQEAPVGSVLLVHV